MNEAQQTISYAWTFIEPTIWLLSLAFTISIWAQTRRARSRTEKGEFGPPTILNLSGHPIAASQDDWHETYIEENVTATFVTSSAQALSNQVAEIIEGLGEPVNARLAVGDPNVVVALPGLAPAAYHILVECHGRFGHFPKATYPLRMGDRFVYVKPHDSHELRLKARLARGAS